MVLFHQLQLGLNVATETLFYLQLVIAEYEDLESDRLEHLQVEVLLVTLYPHQTCNLVLGQTRCAPLKSMT